MSEPVALIPIAPGIAFDPRELEESFIRASGPGGQNVNKVSTAVQVRLDLRREGTLPEALRARVERMAGSRVTGDGVLVLTAQKHRSQDRNRQDALERIVEILRAATVRVAPRVKTKPSYSAKRKRVEGKVKRGAVKRLRGTPGEE
jgi:ribosome-associated protein